MSTEDWMPVEALKAAPAIYKHIDGPVLRWGSQMHWLTLRERLSVFLRRETAETLAQQVWPARAAWAKVA